MFLIQRGDERQCVESLVGYEDWTVLKSGEDSRPPDDEAEYVNGDWVVPLAVLRRHKIDAPKTVMAALRRLGVQTPYGRFAADHQSQSSLSSALAVAGENYSQAWTLHDNTAVTLNLTALRAVCVLVQAFESGLHQRLQTMRLALENCATAAEIAAVEF